MPAITGNKMSPLISSEMTSSHLEQFSLATHLTRGVDSVTLHDMLMNWLSGCNWTVADLSYRTATEYDN